MAVATAFCSSAKGDLLSGLHCFNATVAPTATTTSGAFTLSSVSSLVGLAVGMGVAGAGVTAGSVIASIDTSTGITISKPASASAAGVALSVTGDTFRIALVKVAPTGTYDAATTNYTELTGNSDEVTGTGYTAGGAALVNVSPVISGTTGYVNFSPNPSWTSASFSTTGAMIYNNSRRGPIATRSVSTHDFGGTQTVSSGTLTLVMPTPAQATAILRIA